MTPMLALAGALVQGALAPAALAQTIPQLPPAATAPAPEAPASPTGSISFARLLVEDGDGRLLGADDSWRTRFLDQMRRAGLTVRGTDDLLFGKNESTEADFLLAGTVKDVQVRPDTSTAIEVSVEWKVLDRRKDAVVYTVLTRGYVSRAGQSESTIATAALDDALARLLARPNFRQSLRIAAPTPSAPTWTTSLAVKACARATGALPAGMPAALQGVVTVRAGGNVGSGVMISPDGYVVTAAHVVPPGTTPQVTTSGGPTLPATVVRADPGHDVAVLHVAGTRYPCLTPRATAANVGEELYAVGSPGALELSVSKGVVSGLRQIDPAVPTSPRFLQTDAAINPGNSGGPLLDGKGEVLAVVSWKVAAPGFEGLGFGVPIDAVTGRLGIRWAEISDAAPVPAVATTGSAVGTVPVTDTPDPARIASAQRHAQKRRGEVGKVIRNVGIGASAGGLALVAGTGAWYAGAEEATAGTWSTMVTVNTMGWLLLASGAGAVVTGVALDAPVHVGIGPGTVGISGRF